MNCLSLALLFAEGEAAAGQSDMWKLILPPLAIILVLYVLMDSPQRRDRKKRDAMLKNLKKDDRVVTIGGIIGSVANISQDNKEVTLKVDDGSRIRFRRTAISEVLTPDPAPDAKST